MEKLKSVLKSIYSSDSKLMLYLYIAIAVIAVLLILIIIISTIVTKSSNKKNKQPLTVNDIIPETKKEEQVMVNEVPIEEKPIVLTESAPEIKPLPVEEPKLYDKPLELSQELDLTRPIQRISSATDLLTEFLPNDKVDINEPIINIKEEITEPIIEEEIKPDIIPPPQIFSSVFLDKKPEEISKSVDKPKINLELTPINPIKIDEIQEAIKKEELNFQEKNEPQLVEQPKEEVIIDETRDDSLDTKVDIFSHESLGHTSSFDPFQPKTQEELVPEKKETPITEEIINKEQQPVKQTVLTTEDLRKRLSKLQVKTNNQTEAKAFDKVIKKIDLDEIPDFSQMTREESRSLRK